MLGSTKTSDTRQTGPRCLCTSQLSVKDSTHQEGPECVTPVVIPALAPALDKSLKADWSMPS